MRVLLSTNQVVSWTGAELYVADVARALHTRGHDVVVHTVLAGPLAEHLQRRGIPVVRRPRQVKWRPDVIHAQGNIGTRAALTEHPGVPALFVCHTHDQWTQFVSPHPSVRRYAGVSRVCVEALLRNGAPPDRTTLLPNFVDTTQFARRAPLPPKPRRALMFSNFARPGGYLDAVTKACTQLGLDLDALGAGTGTASRAPQDVLTGYDVVFAKGRAAMEALAVGCAVVLCDFAGVGPMVSTADFDRLRSANFGFEMLTGPHDPEVLCEQIRRYDATDASAVCDRLRAEASLTRYATELESLYAAIIGEAHRAPTSSGPRWLERGRIRALTLALRTYHRLPLERRLRMRPLTRTLLRAP